MDLKDSRFWVVGDKVLAFGKRYSKELCCCEENAIEEHTFKLEVWLHQTGVQRVFFFPENLGVESPVPARKLSPWLISIQKFFELSSLSLCIGHCSRGDLLEHCVCQLWLLSSLVRKHILCMIGKTQKLRALGSHIYDFKK